MFLVLINYAVRLIVVLIGIALLIIPATMLYGKDMDMTNMRVMGIVILLFGIYRVTTYYSHLKRYREDED